MSRRTKDLPEVPALPMPTEAGSYLRDPETGALIRQQPPAEPEPDEAPAPGAEVAPIAEDR